MSPPVSQEPPPTAWSVWTAAGSAPRPVPATPPGLSSTPATHWGNIWENMWKILGKCWEHMETCGYMGQYWKHTGNSGKQIGKILGNKWGKYWEQILSHGKILAKKGNIWDTYWENIAHLWEHNRKSYRKYWKHMRRNGKKWEHLGHIWEHTMGKILNIMEKYGRHEGTA